ncbi:hypothetical protein AB5J56_02160 [Streptomyces sp. R21]|uniref:Uncharacterized protein n=1 Tax=Streptomyces sp. R21 TaxID=3238627 RepID=A0AB39P0A0_9ACTN
MPELRAYRAGARPRGGDGNELHTYWHKDGRDRDRWCRSFVDLLDTGRVAAGPAARV